MKFAPFYATVYFLVVTHRVSSLLQTNLKNNALKSSQQCKGNYETSEQISLNNASVKRVPLNIRLALRNYST